MNKDYYYEVEERVLKQINSEEYDKAFHGTEQSKTDKNHF